MCEGIVPRLPLSFKMSLDDFKADLLQQVVPFRTASLDARTAEKRLRLVSSSSFLLFLLLRTPNDVLSPVVLVLFPVTSSSVDERQGGMLIGKLEQPFVFVSVGRGYKGGRE